MHTYVIHVQLKTSNVAIMGIDVFALTKLFSLFLPELPYRFDFMSSQDIPDWGQTLRRAQWIIHKYSLSPG